jgi:hypothetical protein
MGSTGGMAVILGLVQGQTPQNPVARPQRGIAGAQEHQHAGFRPLACPFQRAGEQVTIRIGGQNLQHGDRRQIFSIAIGGPALGQLTRLFQFLEDALEVNPRRPLDPERARDVALGGLGRVVGDEGEDFGFRRDLCHPAALAWCRQGVITFTCKVDSNPPYAK